MEKNKNTIVQFFKNESKKLINYIKKKVQKIENMDAEDMLSDVMLKILKQDDIDYVDNFTGYVYRALQNKIIDYYRKKDNTISLNSYTNSEKNTMLLDILPDKIDLNDEIERKELKKRLFQAISDLKPSQKAIFVATEIEGITFRELSQEWNEPIGTLLARKSRAVKNLRESLQDLKNK